MTTVDCTSIHVATHVFVIFMSVSLHVYNQSTALQAPSF